MCDSSGIVRSKSLRRVNSGGLDFDNESYFIGGNIKIEQTLQESIVEDSDLNDSDEDEGDLTFGNDEWQPMTLEEYEKVNKILSDIYGIKVIELASKCILNGQINSNDFVIQALSYKMQKLNSGNKGVRYLPSWGRFWASVREIIRARGLVPFLDHFEVTFFVCKFTEHFVVFPHHHSL